METITKHIQQDQHKKQTIFGYQFGLLPYDTYNDKIKYFKAKKNFMNIMLPQDKFRMKFLMKAQISMMSSIFSLSFRHNQSSPLHCSRQFLGKYVFFSKKDEKTIQQAYMSKYDNNQYKLYLRDGSDKIEVAYFMLNHKEGKDKQKIRILIPIEESNGVLGIKSNTKKQSQIKWRWYSKNRGISSMNIDVMLGNILKLKYIYVSKGDTLSDRKMIMRQLDDKVWQYYIENPLTILQSFALAVLMAENIYT